MLSNAYFLAKFRFDTAENEPANFFAKFANFANPDPRLLDGEGRRVRDTVGSRRWFASLLDRYPHLRRSATQASGSGSLLHREGSGKL